MQAEKEARLRKPRPGELDAIMGFLRSLGVDTVNPPVEVESLGLLEVPGAVYRDVFEVPEWITLRPEVYGLLYATGYYIGLIAYRRGQPVFKPGLPLAHRLSRLCGTAIECHVVDEAGERILLYGRPVPLDLTLSVAGGLSVVVNTRNEALGWARLRVRGGKGYLEPLLDLGWYLRRGG